VSRRVLLVASKLGYQTRTFDEAASRLGVGLSLATDRCHMLDDPWRDRAVAVKFDDPEGSAAQIEPRFDAVVAVGDRPAELAAHVAARLGLRFHPPAAVQASRNKFLARGCFQAAGLLTPRFFRATLDEADYALARAEFPCVLKPLGLSASRGVIRANDAAEFAAAFARIRQLLDEPDIRRLHDPADRFIQIEEYIPGREFAVEGLVRGGRLQPLALFDKPDPLEGPYFEETIYVTPSREASPVRQALLETTRAPSAGSARRRSVSGPAPCRLKS
jgi:biotin carboxylase